MWVGGVQEGVTSWGEKGTTFSRAYKDVTAWGQLNLLLGRGRLGWEEEPGSGPEKQTHLTPHQADGKRQVVGYRIELYMKSEGFS